MLRWLFGGVVGVVVTAFAFLLVTGRYINDGDVIVRFSSAHGLHEGDVLVLGAWVGAMLSLLGILATSGRRPTG